MAHSGRRDELVLDDTEFRMLSDLLREHCGLHFAESRFLLEKRLARRIRELGLGSCGAYHYLLRDRSEGDRELAHVVDELTTNETYFFRERDQLRALIEEIIPELRSGPAGGAPRRVNIWSAGCSSGEEPYSIVMLALEAGLVPGRDLRVHASDISRRMLERARRGVYRPGAFRETESELRDRYFEARDGLFHISDAVKKHVAFTHLNLLDRSRLNLIGPMQVILCRNVIIYFDLETKRQVIRSFERKLVPGGYLLLGHSESLVNISNAFALRSLRNDLVYCRPLDGDDGEKDPDASDGSGPRGDAG